MFTTVTHSSVGIGGQCDAWVWKSPDIKRLSLLNGFYPLEHSILLLNITSGWSSKPKLWSDRIGYARGLIFVHIAVRQPNLLAQRYSCNMRQDEELAMIPSVVLASKTIRNAVSNRCSGVENITPGHYTIIQSSYRSLPAASYVENVRAWGERTLYYRVGAMMSCYLRYVCHRGMTHDLLLAKQCVET